MGALLNKSDIARRLHRSRDWVYFFLLPILRKVSPPVCPDGGRELWREEDVDEAVFQATLRRPRRTKATKEAKP